MNPNPNSQENPEVQKPPSLEEIKARIGKIKADTDRKKDDWETEKKTLVAEVITTARGNENLAKKITKNSSRGKGYSDIEEKSLGAVHTLDRELRANEADYQTTRSEIEGLKKDAQTNLETASEADREQYVEIIAQLDTSLGEYSVAHLDKQREVKEAREKAAAKHNALLERHQGFKAEQQDASKEPLKHARETTLRGKKELEGKDLDGKKFEIEEAVNERAYAQRKFEEAKEALFEQEKYLTSVEARVEDFNGTLSVSLQNALPKFAEFEKDLDADTDDSLKASVVKLKRVVTENQKASFWQKEETVRMRRTGAEQELRELKSAQEKKLQEIFISNINPVDEIFRLLSYNYKSKDGRVSVNEGEVGTQIHSHTMDQWIGLSKTHPDIFGDTGTKLTALAERTKEVKSKVIGTRKHYEGTRGLIINRNTELTKKIEALFGPNIR